ncbi:MAG: hypothetical protein ACREAG_07305 [Nitrosopumilaceae archaeon]
MDFDGITLLMEKENTEFNEWRKNKENYSLEQLRQEVKKRHESLNESKRKYADLKAESATENIGLQFAKTAYYFLMTGNLLEVLFTYTSKLEEENDKLKKSKKNQATKKTGTKLSKSNSRY